MGGIGVTVSALVRGATMMSMSWFEPDAALAHIERRRAEHLFPAFPPLTLGLLRAHPAMELARADLREWAGVARQEIMALPDVPARAAFEGLCDFVVERTG